MHAIFYTGDITPIGVRNTKILIAKAIKRGRSDITLVLASLGGDATSGIALYHFMQALPVEINTHAFGVCSSIAATIFTAGKWRTAEDPCQFVLHAPRYREGLHAGKLSPRGKLVSEPFRRLGWDDVMINQAFMTGDERCFDLRDAINTGLVHEHRVLKLGHEDTFAVANFAISPDDPPAFTSPL